jgi:hypothetical protein
MRRRQKAVPSEVVGDVLFNLWIIVVARGDTALQGFSQKDGQNSGTTARIKLWKSKRLHNELGPAQASRPCNLLCAGHVRFCWLFG